MEKREENERKRKEKKRIFKQNTSQKNNEKIELSSWSAKTKTSTALIVNGWT